MAEKIAESAISRVGQVANKMQCAHEVTEAAIDEVRSVHREVQSKVALLMAHADVSTAHAIEVLSGCVQEVARYSEAQMSRVAEAVAQKLEKEIEGAVTSTAVTTKI